MNNYRISIQGSAAPWHPTPVCSLEISMGNMRQVGEKLAAMVLWAESHFELCLFHIGDTLYRHNYEAAGLSPADARAQSRAAGDQWLEKHDAIIKSCAIPTEIVRWDHWLTHKDFPSLHAAIRDLYLTDESFRRAVMTDVWTLMERQHERVEAIGTEKFISSCIAFLLEEAAGDTLMARTHHITHVYPGPTLATFRYLARPETPATVAGLGRNVFTHINVKKRGNPPAKQQDIAA